MVEHFTISINILLQ